MVFHWSICLFFYQFHTVLITVVCSKLWSQKWQSSDFALLQYSVGYCIFLKRKGIPDHFTCLLRNLSVDQEATVRTRHGTMAWFKIGKGPHQGCISSCCLFNFYEEYIMWNSRLDESQSGIKTARRNINLRYADNITLMAENEEELKKPLNEDQRGKWKS